MKLYERRRFQRAIRHEVEREKEILPERKRKCQQGDSGNTLDDLKWQNAISPAAGQHDLAAMETGRWLEGAE